MAGLPSTPYKLNYSRRRLTDDGLHHLRRELPLRQDNYPFEEVDFSQNEMSSVGLSTVLDVCRRCPKLRVLKLYKNQIDDGGAEGLAELCKQCPAIEEMHLSHNHFTATGVEVLVTAAEQARPQHVSPLWLRLEQNDVANPDAVFTDLSSRLSVCSRQDEVRCTVRMCIRKQKVHLPFFHLQRSNRLRDAQTAGGYGGAPSYRVPRDEASPAFGPSHSVTPKHGMPVRSVVAAPSVSSAARAAALKSGMLANGTGSAWDLDGANAARRLAQSTPGVGAGSPAPVTAAAAVAATAQQPTSAAQPPGGERRQDSPHVEEAPPEKPTAAQGGAKTGAWATPGGGAAPGAQTWPMPDAAASDSLKREGSMENVDMSPTPARQRKAPDEPGQRASLVLDHQNRRRIVASQLEAEGTDCQFVCSICSFVMISPVITSCVHLFCKTCFNDWVSDQVAKSKKGGDGPVQLIPCPQPNCTQGLRKKDIMELDKAQAAHVQLLQRMRNNLRIRCVHHSSHFPYDFGKDAELVNAETGMTCVWVGDLAAYEEHVNSCPIENHLRLPSPTGTASVESAPASSAATENGHVSPAGTAASSQQAPPMEPDPPADSGAQVAAVPKPDPAPVDVLGTRVAKYDYSPPQTETKGQIALKSNDLVKIFEVTDSGWAAGVRLCKETMQEVGDAGWFPHTYLYPPDHVAKA